MITNILPWISILSLIAYTPILSYLDWKYRDIGTHKLWLPLIAINIPVLIAGYLTSLYPPIMLFISMMVGFAWFLLFHRRGADCIFLICITTFAVVHPVTGANFIQPFLVYLIIFTAATFWGIWLDNRIRKHINNFEVDGGIPYLIVISLALVMTVVM